MEDQGGNPTAAALNAQPREWLDLFSGGGDTEIVLPIFSGSMAGAILPGDLLTVRPLHGKKAHWGDIVVFRENGKLVAHRLIFSFRLLTLDILVVKGDANRDASVIKRKAVVGSVLAVRRNGSMVLSMTSDKKRSWRRISSRSLMGYLSIQVPRNLIKWILGRDV